MFYDLTKITMIKQQKQSQSSNSENSFKEGLNSAMGDMSSMINSGFGVLSGVKQEFQELVKTWVESSLQKMAIPTRDEIESMDARIDDLKAKVEKLEAKTSTRSNPK